MSGAWEIRMSRSRQVPYFFNSETSQSKWEAPEGLTQGQIDSLPGAAFLSSSRPDQVRASHILVKHSGSRNPHDRKRALITRSKQEAIEILLGYRSQIGSLKEFEDLAAEHSDCNSAKNGGDLGVFGPRKMQKPFEDAAFALNIGEISDVVDTESGVHLIIRTELSRPDKPVDDGEGEHR